MSERVCEQCNLTMMHGDIRQTDPRTSKKVCSTCLNNPNVPAMPERIHLAHGGGDGMTIRHCFNCGSGGVVARSDGSAECTFCQQVFTVRVQPHHVNSPQTVNGVPVDIPGMPGQEQPVEDPAAVAPEEAVEGNPVDADGDGVPENIDNAHIDSGLPGFSDVEVPDISQQGEFTTAAGLRLSRRAYVQHMALEASAPSEHAAVLARVRRMNQH